MYELTGRIANVSFDYISGKPLVTLELNERSSALAMVDELKCHEKLTLRFGKFKNKRSLDANAYCWVLIDKLAEKKATREKLCLCLVTVKLCKNCSDLTKELTVFRAYCLKLGLEGIG